MSPAYGTREMMSLLIGAPRFRLEIPLFQFSPWLVLYVTQWLAGKRAAFAGRPGQDLKVKPETVRGNDGRVQGTGSKGRGGVGVSGEMWEMVVALESRRRCQRTSIDALHDASGCIIRVDLFEHGSVH